MLSQNLNKQKAKKQLAEQKQNDFVLNKLMLFFVVAVVGIFGTLFAARNLRAEAFFYVNVFPIVLILSAIAFVGAVVYFAIQRGRRIDESAKVITSSNLLGTAAVLLSACIYYNFGGAAKHIVVYFIAATVLYFVYNIFHKDFFICSIIAAIEMILIKFSSVNASTTVGKLLASVSMALAIVIPLLGFVFAIMLHLNKGTLPFGKSKIELIGKDDRLYPIFVICAVSIVGAILTIVTSAAAIYSLVALLAVYLAVAVAYTVRMM